MPLLLIKQNQTGSGPGAYLRGHVVGVYPDGYEFGRLEGPPAFYIAEVPQTYIDAQPELTAEVREGEEMTRRRGLYLDVDSLPPGILQALEVSGLATIPHGIAIAATKVDARVPAVASLTVPRAFLRFRTER